MKKGIIFGLVLFLLGFGSSAYALRNPVPGQSREQSLAVQNPKGEDIGTVTKALADPTGNIAFAVVSLTKMEGEKKEIIVPVKAFTHDGRGHFILNLTDEEIAAAPVFKTSDLRDPSFPDRLYRFYGQTPSWSDGQRGAGK